MVHSDIPSFSEAVHIFLLFVYSLYFKSIITLNLISSFWSFLLPIQVSSWAHLLIFFLCVCVSDPVPWNSRIYFTLKIIFAIFDMHVWWDVHLGIHVIITSPASQIMVNFFENIMFTLKSLLVWYLESVTGIFFCQLFSCVWNRFFPFFS